MELYNTLPRKVEPFAPTDSKVVKIYTCGPTVYDYQHIGNYSGYIYWDILVRLLKSNGYSVNRVMNITDVGHLVSDADEGEDKLEKGAKREGKTAREVADYYTEDFFDGINELNLLKPDKYAKATDYIPQQIEMIETLLEKGFAYKTEQAIYFDTRKLDDYGKLTGQSLAEKEVGARSDVVTDTAKQHPQDFALWFFRVGRFANHEMYWTSPWGDGFPGWHIECSAIVHTLLGEPIDIHTGGIDHIGTHHTNEIAQTEAAFGKPLSKFWLHNNHMMVEGQKISKSLNNGFTLADLKKRDFSAMDFKMLVLQSHYRSQSNFTWEALGAARNALNDIKAWSDARFQSFESERLRINYNGSDGALASLHQRLSEDINTPMAVATLAGMVKRVDDLGYDSEAISQAVKEIDNLLGLDLSLRQDISSEQHQLIKDRESARQNQDFERADELRDQLKDQGIGLKDIEQGTAWFKL